MPTNNTSNTYSQLYAKVEETWIKLANVFDINLFPTVNSYYANDADELSDYIKKVIYNPPATIVLWDDGEKTVVKCHGEDEYDPLKGFLLCVMKKLCGNNGAYNDVIRKHCPAANDILEKKVTDCG